MLDQNGPSRRVIVNADDFGQSPGINSGIIESLEQGIVTSASLMVRWPAAREAAQYARAHPQFSVGLHCDLGEWIYRESEWKSLYEVVCLDDPSAVESEVRRQLAEFRRLTGQNPTHLDSHQHVHRSEPTRSILVALASELAIPLRHFSHVNYCGDFYGQLGTGEPLHEAISVEGLMEVLRSIPAGLTELACHPGYDTSIESLYRTERAIEVATLCDPRIRQAIETAPIGLISFLSIRNLSA